MVTWGYHLELSRDQHNFAQETGNIVETLQMTLHDILGLRIFVHNSRLGVKFWGDWGVEPFLIWKYDARTVQFASSKYNDFMPDVLSTILHVTLKRKRPGFLEYITSDSGWQLFFHSCICDRLYSSQSRNIAFTSDIQYYLYTVLSFGSEFPSSSEVNAKILLCTMEVHTLSFWPISRSICPSNRMAFMMVDRKWPGTVITIV